MPRVANYAGYSRKDEVNMFAKWVSVVLVSLALGVGALTAARPVYASDQVVTNCSNDTELRADLTTMQSGTGGTLTFNCGTLTINLSNPLPDITKNTEVDGGNKITLSGLSAVRLFNVGGTGTLTLKNIVLENGYVNSADGGGIYNDGHLLLDHTTIRFSHSPLKGGAIYTNGRVDVTHSMLANNVAADGGAIYAGGMNAQVVILDSKFNENTAGVGHRGGAIYSEVPLSITDSEFAMNVGGSGGAIAASRVAATTTASITGSNFHDNKTTGSFPNANGAALLVDNVPVTVDASTLHDNNAQSGGAIYVLPGGQLTVTDSTLRHNSSTNGGGIYNKGTAMLNSVTLSSNDAAHGGAIDNFGTLGMFNVTLSGNSGSYGGGLKNEGGNAGLVSVTMSNNQASLGSGIYNVGTSTVLTVKNTIIANSPSGDNCGFPKAPTSLIFNLSSDNTCGFGGTSDNANLLLGPLADNGGPTLTHLPQKGSDAIDKGTDDSPHTDQRGLARPQGAGFDVGAVEACQKPAKPFLRTPGNTKKAKGPHVTLDWDGAVCTQTYKVILRLGSSTGSKVEKKGGLTETTFTTTKALTKGVTYAWVVKACNPPYGCTKSDWSTFTVKKR